MARALLHPGPEHVSALSCSHCYSLCVVPRSCRSAHSSQKLHSRGSTHEPRHRSTAAQPQETHVTGVAASSRYGAHAAGEQDDTTRQGGHLDMPASPTLVSPPAVCAWQPELANTVQLTGLVTSQPVLRSTENQALAEVCLSINPPQPHTDKAQHGSVMVDFTGHEAHQAVQHLRPGITISITGSLRLYNGQDERTGSWHTLVRIDGHSLKVVDQNSLPHGAVRAPAPRRQRQPQAPAAPMPAMASAHHLFHVEGLPQVAERQQIMFSIAANYVLACVAAGFPVAWDRLAAELQLGPTGLSWMTAAEINTAINVADAQIAIIEPDESEPCEISSLRFALLVCEQLQSGISTAAKLDTQEKLYGESDGCTITLQQIYLVVLMRRHGVDWDSLIVSTPKPFRRPRRAYRRSAGRTVGWPPKVPSAMPPAPGAALHPQSGRRRKQPAVPAQQGMVPHEEENNPL